MNSQIQFETNGLRVLVVPVFDDAENISVTKSKKDKNFWLRYASDYALFDRSLNNIELSGGNWKLLSTTDAITEEQAAILCVSYLETEYPDYSGPYEYVVYENGNDTAKDELFEILRSKGINPNEKHVILIESK